MSTAAIDEVGAIVEPPEQPDFAALPGPFLLRDNLLQGLSEFGSAPYLSIVEEL